MQRYSREQWAEWIEEQKSSGLTIAEFCQSIGVSTIFLLAAMSVGGNIRCGSGDGRCGESSITVCCN